MSRPVCALILLFAIPIIFFGQQTENEGDVYAIVVGISKYNYIRPLSYADRDADLFTAFLRSPAGGRIKDENLFLMKNDSANAGNFWSTLLRVSNKNLKKGDRVYIFFAGHGDGVKGLNEYYLLLSDCQAANDGNNYMLSFGVIDMYHLKNRLGVLTSKGVDVVLILDACRTNELAGGYASQVFNSSIIQTKVGEIAMLATGPGQVSIEDASLGQGHGLFTYNLVDALSGRADIEENGNHDQKISLKEIQRWVSKNVNTMSAKFNVKQDPVFCCDEKNNTTIGIVDSNFSIAWNQLKQLENISSSSQVNKNQRNGQPAIDSSLLKLYNSFNSARNNNNLWGLSSADDYFDQMKTKFPNEKLTEDARYALAADFINFVQKKINLYLEGQDLPSIEILKEKSDSISQDEFFSEEYEKIKKTISEKWTIAGMMLEKAGKLLSSNNDSTILFQLRPKINFLLARGYLSYEKENWPNYDQALKIANDAYKSDSSAAYTAECLGLLYAYRLSFQYRYKNNQIEWDFGSSKRSDTSLYLFHKAMTLAPNWVNPYRSIALKVYGWYSQDSALLYLKKAMAIDPRNPSTYVITADFLHPFFHGYDSVLYYYKMALSLSPQSAIADIYSKIGRAFSRFQPGKEYFLKRVKDSVLWYSYKALSIDKKNINAYKNLSELYQNENKIDSVLIIYRQARSAMPKDANPYYWLIRAFSYLKSNPDSVFFYSKQLLSIDPENPVALFQIAKFYDNKKVTDSAILYYKRSIFPEYSLDWTYERLGYLTMSKNKNDTLALHYFTELFKSEVPGGWRTFYNIACYYANHEDLEKSIEFLEKALAKGMRNYKQLTSDPLLTFLQDKEPFIKLIKKYFPN
jgi:Tfp pilus assembly protein PilF